jgi:hypothetical protein
MDALPEALQPGDDVFALNLVELSERIANLREFIHDGFQALWTTAHSVGRTRRNNPEQKPLCLFKNSSLFVVLRRWNQRPVERQNLTSGSIVRPHDAKTLSHR